MSQLQFVYLLWGLFLVVVYLAVIPLVIFLLYRILRMARFIEQYFAEAAAAGVSIAENTSHVKALEQTIQVATAILSVAGNINTHSDTIKNTLAARAGANGQGGQP